MEEYGNACKDLVGEPEEKSSPERTTDRLGDNGILSNGMGCHRLRCVRLRIGTGGGIL
jgi:hypothetical protein